MANYWRFGTQRLKGFVDSCRGLGSGFTKLQVTHIAASSGLFPLLTNYSRTWFDTKSIPFPALRVGDFGLVTSSKHDHPTKPVTWSFLATSHHVKGPVCGPTIALVSAIILLRISQSAELAASAVQLLHWSHKNMHGLGSHLPSDLDIPLDISSAMILASISKAAKAT